MIKGLLTEGKTKTIFAIDWAKPGSEYTVRSHWKTDKDGYPTELIYIETKAGAKAAWKRLISRNVFHKLRDIS